MQHIGLEGLRREWGLRQAEMTRMSATIAQGSRGLQVKYVPLWGREGSCVPGCWSEGAGGGTRAARSGLFAAVRIPDLRRSGMSTPKTHHLDVKPKEDPPPLHALWHMPQRSDSSKGRLRGDGCSPLNKFNSWTFPKTQNPLCSSVGSYRSFHPQHFAKGNLAIFLNGEISLKMFSPAGLLICALGKRQRKCKTLQYYGSEPWWSAQFTAT